MSSSFLQLMFEKFGSLFSYLSPFYDIIKYVSAPKLITDAKGDADDNTHNKGGSHLISTLDSNSSANATTVSDGDADDDDDSGYDLFSKPSTYNAFSSSSKTLRSCAVSEFDYDFTSPNPFSWDFQHLVLANQLNSGNPSLPNNNDPTNRQHFAKNNAIDENINGVNSTFNNPKAISIGNATTINNSKETVTDIDNNDNSDANDDIAVPTNLLFNNHGPQFSLNTLEDYHNQNLENQEAGEVLGQFSASFQNQLKRNELYQIYQNQRQTHDDQLEAPETIQSGERVDLISVNGQKDSFADEDKDHHISEDEADFSDDYYDDYLHSNCQQPAASPQPPFAGPNSNIATYHFDSDNEDDDGDRDTVPLDEELLMSFLRRSNDNTLLVYYMNSDLSEGNTVSPHTATSDSVSDSSPMEQTNLLKREIESDIVNENHSKSHKMLRNSNIIIHDNKSASVGTSKIADPSIENNAEPKKKYRKLASESKPSVSLTFKDTSPATANTISSDGNNTLFSTVDTLRKQKLDDQNQPKPEKLYVCPICQTTFKVKGYLTRHRKKHFASKPFRCPYFDPSIDYDDNDEMNHHNMEDCDVEGNSLNADHEGSRSKVPRCHPTGGFSRRDTFKTHLKALHFVYPTGTKSGDRSDKKGRCAACFKEFKTNKEWLETHVMTNQCEGMITEYK